MAKKLSLFDDSSDSEVGFGINKSYAENYDVWRNKEEMQKLKDLSKNDSGSSSSESEEEEVPEVDVDFFRALSLLKSKDPRIYDKDFVLFKEKEVEKKPNIKKEKPLTLKDYERNLILERNGKFSDEEENVPYTEPTYDEEQEELKRSFKADLEQSDSDAEGNDLLKVRTKTKSEAESEEADYLQWLKGEEKNIPEDVKKDMTYLRNYWNDPNLPEDEKFLRDYLLNKEYLEKDDSEIPTYEEITKLSEDEKEIERQEAFEYKYNHRFEEPDEEFIKRFPRTIGSSLRRTNNKRKLKREEYAERKRKEKEQRREELKRLKALKRKEIEEKFLKLKEISGKDEINLDENDIESDFDPDKHDQKMKELFDDDYYHVEEEQKPEFPYDEELDVEDWNAWDGEPIEADDESSDGDNNTEKHQNHLEVKCEDEKNDLKKEFEREVVESTLPKKKKLKKKSLFAKVISKPKPVFPSTDKSFEEYLDEYYKMDYEDLIGDLPVRFKYRKVIPNDFGLTVDEILAANDKELNRWCSVKKTCQYRNDAEELYDVQAFKKKAENISVKQKILSTVYSEPIEKQDPNVDTVNGEVSKKRRKKSKGMKKEVCNEKNELPNSGTEISEINLSEDSKLNISAGTMEINGESICNSELVNHQDKTSKKKRKKKKKKIADPMKHNLNSNCDSLGVGNMNMNFVSNNQLPEREAKVQEAIDDTQNKESKPHIINNTEINGKNSCNFDSAYNQEKMSKKKRKRKSKSGQRGDNDKIDEKTNERTGDSKTFGNQNDELVSTNEQEKMPKKKVKIMEETANQLFDNSSNIGFENFKMNQNSVLNNHTMEVSEKLKLEKDITDIISVSKNSEKIPKKKIKLEKCADSNQISLPKTDVHDTEIIDAYFKAMAGIDKLNSGRKHAEEESLRHNNKGHNANLTTPNQNSKFVSNMNMSKSKHKKQKSGNRNQFEHNVDDKRLGLSDQRLAAYGINPKKFKNRIIYSQK